MRNGFEAITIVYQKDEVFTLKRRNPGFPSYSYNKSKPKNDFYAKIKFDVLFDMFYSHKQYVAYWLSDGRTYRYYIYT